MQGLLSRSEREAFTIGALVRCELDALGSLARSERVTVGGPEVRLRSRTVQTLSLALHELATNARKYGALSGESGHLSITWDTHRRGNEDRLAVDWVESGVHLPPRNNDRASGGYGRELIERALPYNLGAATRFDLTDTGLHCGIDLPIRHQMHDGEGG